MKKYTLLLLLLTTVISLAQESRKSLFVKKINQAITIDGQLDESIWETASVGDDFWEFFPTDSIKSEDKTEVRVLYDDQNLYLGIKSNTRGDDFQVGTLKRDFAGRSNDNTSILLDTYMDATTAYMFGINTAGAMREGLISNGGSDRNSYNLSWDTRWYAEAKTHDNYYIVEMAIPFKSIKYQEGAKKWRFQCYRFDNQSKTQSIWSRVPQNQILINLAFTGELEFEEPLKKSKTPIELIPYVNTISSRNFSDSKGVNSIAAGADAKIAVGNNLNLDVTFNPDFSNVEVDNVVTNITRFEVSLPEKRQFFIDNSDLFGAFGSSRDANPFFSRRIGIARDKDGNNIENKIVGGVRLSGKLNEDWRLGLLSIQTAADEINEIAANNNSMFVLQKKMFARSNVGVFYLDRSNVGSFDFVDPDKRYNKVVGIDYNLASADNVWSGNFYVHKSYQPNSGKDNSSMRTFLNYNTRKWNIFSDLVYLGKDFKSDLGFIRRTDLLKSGRVIEYSSYPKEGNINRLQYRLMWFDFWQPSDDMRLTDRRVFLNFDATSKRQFIVQMRYSNTYTYLTDSFDPTRSNNGQPLDGNQGYHYSNAELQLRTNQAYQFSLDTQLSFGEFYNGTRTSLNLQLNYRFPPKVNLSMLVDYNRIRLPEPYSSADLWLISPKIDVSFTKNLFWATLVQYANQSDNLGINSRLQWRYAPLSDLYLVYNDNYFVNDFEPKYRSINLKLSYRFPI